LILVKYGLERIPYRLSRSKHRDTFVLKGALLFELWTKHTYRATRDTDFLARGDNSPERFVGIFKELCAIEVEPDGLTFDADSVKAERITGDADYEGVCVTFTAHLEHARIPIQIDIRIRRCYHSRAPRNSIPHAATGTQSSPSHLSQRNGCRGEIRGHGQARDRQRPNERRLL
jgi:Nucleotidyl transferase AbiEii toxin, Type IV TA system